MLFVNLIKDLVSRIQSILVVRVIYGVMRFFTRIKRRVSPFTEKSGMKRSMMDITISRQKTYDKGYNE